MTASTFTHNSFPSLREFSKYFDRYPCSIITTYHILRDLVYKDDDIKLKLIDGETFDRECYLFLSETNNSKILYIPISIDATLDLDWLESVLLASHLISKICLCIYSEDSIM